MRKQVILSVILVIFLVIILPLVCYAEGGSQDTNIDQIDGNTLPVPILPAHPYIGCLVATLVSSGATTTATIIPYVAGKTIYVLSISYFSRAATAGNINFYWDTTVCYPAAVSGSIGAGFITDTYLSNSDYKLTVTTPAGCGIIVYYKQL